jgi:hypothetical protein
MCNHFSPVEEKRKYFLLFILMKFGYEGLLKNIRVLGGSPKIIKNAKYFPIQSGNGIVKEKKRLAVRGFDS